MLLNGPPMHESRLPHLEAANVRAIITPSNKQSDTLKVEIKRPNELSRSVSAAMRHPPYSETLINVTETIQTLLQIERVPGSAAVSCGVDHTGIGVDLQISDRRVRKPASHPDPDAASGDRGCGPEDADRGSGVENGAHRRSNANDLHPGCSCWKTGAGDILHVTAIGG
jgi:hypothetical protein